MWVRSFGDITKTKYWLSFEQKPWRWSRWGFSIMPGTYCGTTKGLIIMLPFMVVLGHVRDLNWKPSETTST